MNWRIATTTMLVLAATAGMAFYAGRASATGVPATNPLTYSGTLFDGAGNPVKASVQVRVRLFDGPADNGDPAKCTSPVVMTEAGTGRFDVALGDACAVAVHAQPDLWVEIDVGANPVTMLPRVKAGAVPYALESAVAGQAAGATGKLQQSIEYATAGADQVVALKKQVEDLAADVKLLKSDKAQPTKLLVDFGTSTKLTTSGGTVAFIFTAGFGYNSFEAILLKVDGNLVETWKGVGTQSGSFSYRSFDGSAIISQLPAGVHTVEIAASPNGNAGACNNNGPCSLTAIEFPK